MRRKLKLRRGDTLIIEEVVIVSTSVEGKTSMVPGMPTYVLIRQGRKIPLTKEQAFSIADAT